ncbi:MAG: hypothetical protein IKQ17_06580, partial [Kiritimatiellae bacterium]|nr:hypothetical protein [Kiritimatiellia bacterium]
MAGAHLGNTTKRLVATGVPMSAVPGLSQFWSADAPDGSKLLTWQDFALNRDTNTLVSAQLELFPNGGFIAHSNEVVRVFRRVNPDDWDDDGEPNGTDSTPFVAGEPAFGPHQELPHGANSNAYNWVDVVVSNASSLVTFIGDGTSALPDPSFIAQPGATNRVMLLIGKTYHATSRMPMTCVGKSNVEIETWQDSPTSLSFLWPVTIDVVAMQDGLSFSMFVIPNFLGGGFTWTNSCCSISSSGDYSFTYSCDENCHCTGCAALGCYTYEGFMLPASGGSCGCSAEGGPDIAGTNETPVSASVNVSFSQKVLFYEESYTNEPGVVVGRRASTNTTLTCSVSGGSHGGVFGLSRQGFEKLSFVGGDALPDGTVEIAAGETRSWTAEYAPLSHSASENDISAAATFTEYLSGDNMSSTAQLTVVELVLQPQVTREGCENRHLVGVREIVNCYAHPDVGQWGETGGGELVFRLGVQNYTCPLVSDGSILYYSFCGLRYDFNLTIIEPTAIVAKLPVAKDFGIATNHAGGAGMNLEIFVQPETVSFSGIAMEEIPSTTGIHEDYFSNIYFESEWYHTEARGAGKWINIKASNLWDTDHAWFAGELPRVLPNGEVTFDMTYGTWTNGTMVWNISWGWADHGAEDGITAPVKSISTPYNQTFTFTEDGTLTVSKFQHSVSRGTNGVIRLDGNAVQGDMVTQEELNEVFGNN